MLLGFRTDEKIKAEAAFLVYVIYRSRDVKRGPSGVDMWAQIERFCRSSAKRASGVDEFAQSFKRKMACGTINPRYMKTEGAANAVVNRETGEIMVFDEPIREFGVSVFEANPEEQAMIIDALYQKTQTIILLVRERIEREKNLTEESK